VDPFFIGKNSVVFNTWLRDNAINGEVVVIAGRGAPGLSPQIPS